MRVSDDLALKHYAHLKDKPFFDELIKYIKGELYGDKYKRVLVLVYCGEEAIQKVRKLAGATNPEEADSTSIRGAYGRITTKGVYENVVHVSASQNEAEREIKLWFNPDEIVDALYASKMENNKLVWEVPFDQVIT